MGWIKYGGIILKIGAKIAIDLDCCCDGGCCPDTLISGVTVLVATVISDTTGCISGSVELDDSVSPLIWSSNGVCLDSPFAGLLLGCFPYLDCDGNSIDSLSLFWTFECGSCPEVDTAVNDPCAPVLIPWGWTHGSKSCDPIDFVFSYCLNETSPPSVCPCLTGCVTIRITEKP